MQFYKKLRPVFLSCVCALFAGSALGLQAQTDAAGNLQIILPPPPHPQKRVFCDGCGAISISLTPAQGRQIAVSITPERKTADQRDEQLLSSCDDLLESVLTASMMVRLHDEIKQEQPGLSQDRDQLIITFNRKMLLVESMRDRQLAEEAWNRSPCARLFGRDLLDMARAFWADSSAAQR